MEEQLRTAALRKGDLLAEAVDNLADTQTEINQMQMQYKTIDEEINDLHSQGIYNHPQQSARLRELRDQIRLEKLVLTDKEQKLQRANTLFNDARRVLMNFRNQQAQRLAAQPQDSVEVCGICREPLPDQEVCRLNCGHLLHCHCSQFVDNCPVCRSDITARVPQFGKKRSKISEIKYLHLIFLKN